MTRKIRALMIGAHPDDCDFRCGGIALKYSQAGHNVKFISLVDGSGGHHEMKPTEIATRRLKETQAVAKLANIEYDVWDITDCELMADLPTRKRLVRAIREYSPDIIFTCRPNDYHPDHRNTSLLVQDASYLLIVPNFCPDVPPMTKMPVIMYFYDHFQNPPFYPDVMIDIDDIIEQKFALLDCHVSQVYEWLPFTLGILHTVPSDPVERFEWFHLPRIPRDGTPIDKSVLSDNSIGACSEYREATPSIKYRDALIEKYGEKGEKILFSEAFSTSEYGSPLIDEHELFPF